MAAFENSDNFGARPSFSFDSATRDDVLAWLPELLLHQKASLEQIAATLTQMVTLLTNLAAKQPAPETSNPTWHFTDGLDIPRTAYQGEQVDIPAGTQSQSRLADEERQKWYRKRRVWEQGSRKVTPQLYSKGKVHPKEVEQDAVSHQTPHSPPRTVYLDSLVLGPPLPSALYVGGLPADIQAHELRRVFAKYGPLTRCAVKTRNGMAYAFVTFENHLAAEQAMIREQGRTFGKYKCFVEWARDPAPRPSDNTFDTWYERRRPSRQARNCPGQEKIASQDRRDVQRFRRRRKHHRRRRRPARTHRAKEVSGRFVLPTGGCRTAQKANEIPGRTDDRMANRPSSPILEDDRPIKDQRPESKELLEQPLTTLEEVVVGPPPPPPDPSILAPDRLLTPEQPANAPETSEMTVAGLDPPSPPTCPCGPTLPPENQEDQFLAPEAMPRPEGGTTHQGHDDPLLVPLRRGWRRVVVPQATTTPGDGPFRVLYTSPSPSELFSSQSSLRYYLNIHPELHLEMRNFSFASEAEVQLPPNEVPYNHVTAPVDRNPTHGTLPVEPVPRDSLADSYRPQVDPDEARAWYSYWENLLGLSLPPRPHQARELQKPRRSYGTTTSGRRWNLPTNYW